MTQKVDAITHQFLSDYGKNNKDKLKATFEYARKVFFPRWDRKKEWKLRQAADLPYVGECDSKKKTIEICLDKYVLDYNTYERAAGERDCLLLLLIHEICHSSSSVHFTGHGKTWQARMSQKSERAKQVGLSALSTMLEEEVAEYRDVYQLRARDVYDQIEDYVYSNQNTTYDEVIESVARRNGSHAHELEADFKSCRKVFNEAKKNSKAL